MPAFGPNPYFDFLHASQEERDAQDEIAERSVEQSRLAAFVRAVARGEATAVPAPTDGETFFDSEDKHGATPLVSIGRIPSANGLAGAHILRRPDGSLTWQGGYWLRRPGEVWAEIGE